MTDKKLTIPTLRRLPLYYNIANNALENGEHHISSAFIAKKLGIDATQVRKDIANIGYSGKPKLGLETKDFSNYLRDFLELDKKKDIILVGAGNLGIALAKYDGFNQYGLKIKAIFDNDPYKIGMNIADKEVLTTKNLSNYITENKIEIAIITIPAKFAQDVANRLVESGIKAIWNFAPVNLALPEDVIVWNQDLAASFITFVQMMNNK